jgi:adenine-specific DNA-methyltransferase
MVDRDARQGVAELDQWFTPFWAAEHLTEDALRGLGIVPVCEPACGTGAFLSAIPRDCPAFGVDIDSRVIPAAIANSGREVLQGDFRTIDLTGREIGLVLGNPPFGVDVIDGFLTRSHAILPDGGRVAMILPGHAFQTPSRVARWMERFAIDVNVIPRTLFPRMSKTLLWAKFLKTGDRRFYGMMLFGEQNDVEGMRPAFRRAAEAPGSWREVVRLALESIGGSGPLDAIYSAIAPSHRADRAHWKPKVRQILQLHHQPVERGRWAL